MESKKTRVKYKYLIHSIAEIILHIFVLLLLLNLNMYQWKWWYTDSGICINRVQW